MRIDSSLWAVTSSLRATEQESSERNDERKRGLCRGSRERPNLRAGWPDLSVVAQETDSSFSFSNRLVLKCITEHPDRGKKSLRISKIKVALTLIKDQSEHEVLF